MKQSEEAIEKVLAGLRGSEIPAGLDSRIVRALRARTAERPREGWRAVTPAWAFRRLFSRPAAVLQCAFTVAVLFGAGLLSHSWRQGQQRASPRMPAGVLQVQTDPTLAGKHTPTLPHDGSRQPARRLAVRAVVHRQGRAAPEAAFAPSYPAPRLPLTREEKLLLHAAKLPAARQDPALNPGVQAVQIARETKEFERFFKQTEEGAKNENR